MQQCRHYTAQGGDRSKQTSSRTAAPPRTSIEIGPQDIGLLLDEVNHRIRNFLAMVEAAVGQTRSNSLGDYRAKLMARISGLRSFYEVIDWPEGGKVDIADLLEATMRPCCANGARVVAGGPRVQLEAKFAFALHLIFHELATNATKYGALSSALGFVSVRWETQHVVGPTRKLMIVWTEHGGPEVKHPRQRGFGSRLIARVLESYGEVQLRFEPAGVVCLMLLDVDRISAPTFSSSASSL